MSTETQTQRPEITFVNRFAAIPLVSSAASRIHTTLASNAYTNGPYATVTGLSTTALQYSQPLQARFAPLIVKADGLANQTFDAVESRYPQINTKPEQITEYVRETRESATQYVRGRKESVTKSLDEKVTSPAWHVAEGVDTRFAPIVDYFEVAVERISGNAEAGPSKPKTASTDKTYQFQRAYALSMNLKDHLYVYSHDQINHLQTQNVLIQRVNDTALTITSLASSSVANVQVKAHDLSATMVTQLQKLQSSTAELSTSLKQSFPTLPDFEHTFRELSAALHSTLTDLRTIIASEASYSEKGTLVSKEITDRVNPLLENIATRVGDVVRVLTEKKNEVKEEAVEKKEDVKEKAVEAEKEVKTNGHHHEKDIKSTRLEPEWLQ